MQQDDEIPCQAKSPAGRAAKAVTTHTPSQPLDFDGVDRTASRDTRHRRVRPAEGGMRAATSEAITSRLAARPEARVTRQVIDPIIARQVALLSVELPGSDPKLAGLVAAIDAFCDD